MKTLTLDETWKLCLSMWRWIAGQIKGDNTEGIDALKDRWLEEHGFGGNEEVDSNCFFCEYHTQHKLKTKKVFCNCPAIKIDKTFDCISDDYHYRYESIAFYNKLVSLNKQRIKGITK